ncbi:MAG: AMP-binding protein [Candidatus Omnitrophica bacterium]|nr:AMP-binding protein [Candidatus Omnitrophota bacterium]MDE2223346.1 AMP-binding protein [Candidatus Omnitrophota bacterium]
MDIYKTLKESATAFRQKPALIFKDKEITYGALTAKVLSLAVGLQGLGLGKGKKIGLYLPNCPEYVYSYLSSFLLGAVVIPMDYMLKADELSACLSHAEADLVIALQKPDIDWENIRAGIPSLKKVVFLGTEFESLYQAGEFQSQPVDESAPALIMYTSGTTGAPKGILLNYKHLQGSPEAMKHFVDLSERDVKLCAIPLSHIGGFIYIQNCLIFGITLVLMDRFHPLDFLKNIAQYKVTCFHIVPPMYTAMLTVKHMDQFDLSSLRWVVVFGAPNSPDILKRFHQYCPNAKLLNGWGMTETCPPNTVTPLSNPKIESVGKPAPNCEIRIVDDEGKPLPAGEVGEIVIRGWVVMQEYYKDPQATSAAKRGGWFHTGDLGHFDQEGFLYIVGRKKEMIKVAGQIVYAPEVEAALCKHEAVLEAAVIGVADDMRGEAVKAFVVLKEGKNVEPLEIKYFAKEHLANFKVPHTVEIRAALPKNRTGKIDKEQLRTLQAV